MEENLLKFIFLGDDYVGKSSIILRFTENKFQITEKKMGIDFNIKIINFENKNYKTQIWDSPTDGETFKCYLKIKFNFKKKKKNNKLKSNFTNILFYDI
jgi:GTP-binding protein EngB required for normal cell division